MFLAPYRGVAVIAISRCSARTATFCQTGGDVGEEGEGDNGQPCFQCGRGSKRGLAKITEGSNTINAAALIKEYESMAEDLGRVK
jgi:hypothetical protein